VEMRVTGKGMNDSRLNGLTITELPPACQLVA
jgi:hypothetical protein